MSLLSRIAPLTMPAPRGGPYAISGMLDDLVSLSAWVVVAGLDRSAEQRPGSNLGCALTMASPQGGGEDG